MTTKNSEPKNNSQTSELNQSNSVNSLKKGLREKKMFPSNSITTEKEIFNLKINKYYGGDTKFKNVFSTNVFIPRELNLDHKSFSYLTGFIKLVETFKKMTSWKEENPTENWGLVIFCDKNLIDGSYINKMTYKRKSKFNTNNNKILKEKYNENSDIIIKLYSLYNKYINHIIKNKYKYNFVKIYTFEDTRLKGTRGYLGLPSTYGSFVRFIPIFTNYPVDSLLKTEFDSIKKVFCINISHAITKNLMTLVLEWEEDGADICTMKSDKYNWENIPIGKYISTIKLLNPVYTGFFYGTNYRIPAGLFGVVKEGINKEYNLFKNYLDILVGKYKTDKTIFNYSIDEILLNSIFLEELKRRDESTNFFLYDDTVAKTFKKLFKGDMGYNGKPEMTIIEDIIKQKGETIEKLSDFNKLYLEFKNYIEKTPDLKKLITIGKDRFSIYKDGLTKNNNRQIYTAYKKLNQKIQEEIKKNPNYSHIIDVLFTIYDYDYNVEKYFQCTDSNIILPYTKAYNETFVKDNPSSYINIGANHIYLSREFMNYIGKNLEDYFEIRIGNRKYNRKYNFSTLLQSGFDEIKPLILYSKNFSFDGVNFNYYLELICIDDYKNTELNKLLNIIIHHYNNTDNLVVEGYKKKSSSKKKKSNKKKSNKKKSNKKKSIKKKSNKKKSNKKKSNKKKKEIKRKKE